MSESTVPDAVPERIVKHIVIYSGGMDSFTLLHWIRKRPSFHPLVRSVRHDLCSLGFNYGQRHAKELAAAERVCRDLSIPRLVVGLDSLYRLARGSALTDTRVDVPHGHYAAENMKKTIVPGRNTVMLAMALAYAEGLLNEDANQERDLIPRDAVIYYGAHAGDHHIYPDCRPAFIYAMRETIKLASDDRVTLRAPFQDVDKGGILAVGRSLGLTAADYRSTWSCYEGGDEPCGKCGACVERAEAFAKVGWEDPLIT